MEAISSSTSVLPISPAAAQGQSPEAESGERVQDNEVAEARGAAPLQSYQGSKIDLLA